MRQKFESNIRLSLNNIVISYYFSIRKVGDFDKDRIEEFKMDMKNLFGYEKQTVVVVDAASGIDKETA